MYLSRVDNRFLFLRFSDPSFLLNLDSFLLEFTLLLIWFNFQHVPFQVFYIEIFSISSLSQILLVHIDALSLLCQVVRPINIIVNLLWFFLRWILPVNDMVVNLQNFCLFFPFNFLIFWSFDAFSYLLGLLSMYLGLITLIIFLILFALFLLFLDRLIGLSHWSFTLNKFVKLFNKIETIL